eukprot:COSAG01_NODE_269_length_19814_cov_109.983720_8_plen_83_part_00
MPASERMIGASVMTSAAMSFKFANDVSNGTSGLRSRSLYSSCQLRATMSVSVNKAYTHSKNRGAKLTEDNAICACCNRLPHH